MDTNDLIIAAFNVLLGRDPDKIGLEYWVKKFHDGIT